jgi:hypothetical protein
MSVAIAALSASGLQSLYEHPGCRLSEPIDFSLRRLGGAMEVTYV